MHLTSVPQLASAGSPSRWQPAGLAARGRATAVERLAGREHELAILDRAVRADGARPLLISIQGARGAGKTALASATHLLGLAEGRPSLFLSATGVEATPAGVRRALTELGLEHGFAELGRRPLRDVLVVDGFERLERVASWFFTELLAHAGCNLTLILTSRRALALELAPFATVIECVELELGAAPRSTVSPADVREALAVFHEARKLECTALAAALGGADPASSCRSELRRGIARMAARHPHAELAALLDATYLLPAVKQRAVAADHGLPWGTYRHRLRRAVEELAEELAG